MKNILMLLLGLTLLASCRKDDLVLADCVVMLPTPPDQTAARGVFQQFVRDHSVATQSFVLNLDDNQSVRTSHGATVFFPAHSFVRPDSTLATGRAELRIREIYTVPEMLLADKPTGHVDPTGTGAGTTCLTSAGEMMLQVWQGPTRLRMLRGRYLRLSTPLPATPDSVRLRGMTLWTLALPTAVWADTRYPATFLNDSLNAARQAFTNRPSLDTVSWWNVDQLWLPSLNTTRTTARFRFDTDSSTATFTRVWLRPPHVNAVFPTYLAGTTGTLENLALLPEVPVGAALTAIVLQVRADGLYFGTQTALIQPNTTSPRQTPNVTLQKLSEAEIVRRMQRL